jgi:hypothetical protein
MRWEGHITCTRDRRGSYTTLVEKPEEIDHYEDLGVDGRRNSNGPSRCGMKVGTESGSNTDSWRILLNVVMGFQVL